MKHLAVWTFEITKFDNCYRCGADTQGGVTGNSERSVDKGLLLWDKLGDLKSNLRVKSPRSTSGGGTKNKCKD